MSQYTPSNSILERVRSMFRRRVKDGELAYLGDTHAENARVDVPGRPGYVYVHFPDGKDTNGFAIYSAPSIARSGNAAYPNYPTAPVYVAVLYNNELEIVAAHYKFLDQVGVNTAVLNPLNQQSKWIYPWQLTYALASAVATSATQSTLVMVKKFRHYTGNTLQAFDTPLQADKIDLAPYIPAADMHCYAAVWIDTYTNTAVVTTSVAQDLDTPLDATDLQELVVRAASSRPADGIPLKAFYLSNDQGTIKQNVFDVDLRQWLDNPVPWGFPHTLTTLERVRPGYTLVVGPYTPSGVGALTIESGGRVLNVHKSNVAGSAPTATDDNTQGYDAGSPWFNSATGILYVATSVATGAAVWTPVVGSGAVSPPFVDTTAIVKGSADATKLLRFEVDGFTTGTTRVLTPPNADITIVGESNTQNISNKTINASSIGSTTRGLGYFNDLRLYSGTGIAAFGHSFTGLWSVFIPGNTDIVLVGEDTLQVLQNKILITPSIGDYTSAQHDHEDAVGGGQLTGAAVNVTAHNAVIGNGTSGLTSLAPGTARNVMISDGTDWTSRALTLADLPNLIAILRDEKTSGTHGGTSATTTWNARDLNTELYDPGGIVSISSNQFTPIAGDYIIDVRTPFLGGSAASSSGRCRLYNVTAATVVEEGENTFALTNGAATTQLTCSFTANGTDVYRVDTYTSVGRATNGLGAQLGLGTPEVYTSVMLRKVA